MRVWRVGTEFRARAIRQVWTVFWFSEAPDNPEAGLFLDCEHPLALDCQQGQNAGRIRAGVDIDPVRSNLRLGHGGMTVHNEFAEVLLALKELIPDPKQILLALLPQRHAWLHPSMREEVISTRKTRSQVAEEVPMVFWHALQQGARKFVLLGLIRLDRRRQTVRHQGLKPAIFLPRSKPTGVLQHLKQKRFVVTLEKDALMATAAFNQQINGLSRRRSTIDIITQKDMQRPNRPGASQMMIDCREHILQEVCTSVDVADCIDPNPVGQFRFGLWLEA